jgi:spore germination cell wall hydrolase CwlJ-like protein
MAMNQLRIVLLIGLCFSLWYGIALAEDVPEIVYQVIAAESANQSDYGMELVAHVVINRARLRGMTLEQVVRQPKQFSALNSLKWLNTWVSRHYDHRTRARAVSALERALISNKWASLTHYHTLAVSPKWARGHEPAIVAGGHAFYEGIK